MEKRLGFIGLVLEDREQSSAKVNELLSGHADIIAARLGLPRQQGHNAVMALIVEADTDELGRLTGQLGRIPGVAVKSMLSKSGTTPAL